jgi:hypothetical protein
MDDLVFHVPGPGQFEITALSRHARADAGER